MRCRTDVMCRPTDRRPGCNPEIVIQLQRHLATCNPSAKQRTAERRDVSQIVQELVRSARQEGQRIRIRIPDTSISDSIQFIAPFKRLPEVVLRFLILCEF